MAAREIVETAYRVLTEGHMRLAVYTRSVQPTDDLPATVMITTRGYAHVALSHPGSTIACH